MKNTIQKAILTVFTLCMVFALLQLGTTQVKAASKTSYTFSSCEVTKFNLAKKRLTIVTEKGAGKGIYMNKETYPSLRKMSFKVAGNCSWKIKNVDVRNNFKVISKKTSYKQMKKYIKFDRNWYKTSKAYNNKFMSEVVVKNNKIVKVFYCN